MADAPKPSGNPMNDFWFILVGLVFLVILWYANGGPNKADLRGIFLHAPAPLGTGDAYGPQYGTPSTTTGATSDPYNYQANFNY